MSILIENISKKYNNSLVLNYVNIEIASGSLVALVGPSGSGKSTLLRIIAGFEKADSGNIWLFGRQANTIPIQDREVGFVFQNYALFNHMNVWQNIEYGLFLRDIPYQNRQKRVRELIKLVQLERLQDRYPKQLSGGQKQRVALARALAIEPKLLLLDEPFGALDEKVKKELCFWLKKLHEKVPVTTIFVTHDQQEALEIATNIVLFNKGKVEQMGSPQEIYDNPVNQFTLDFFGASNNIPQKSSTNLVKNNFLRPHQFKIALYEQGSDSFRKSFEALTIAIKIEKIIYGEPTIRIIGKMLTKQFFTAKIKDFSLIEKNQIFLQMSRKDFYNNNFSKNKDIIFIEPKFLTEPFF